MDKKYDMVDFSWKWVDFLWAFFTRLLLLQGKLQAEPEDYHVTIRLARENGLPVPDINGICF